jgi:hypothetical protein
MGSPRIIAPGLDSENPMKSGMRIAGCCPSESIVSTCVNPSAAASFMPWSTARPLPPLRGITITRSSRSVFASSCSPSAVPSSLPSTTTHTGLQYSRAARTVAYTSRPGL